MDVLSYVGAHWIRIVGIVMIVANVVLLVMAVRGLLEQRAIEKELARLDEPRVTWRWRETSRMIQLIVWVHPSLVPAYSPSLPILDHPDMNGESGRPGFQAARWRFRHAGSHQAQFVTHPAHLAVQ